ncbi:MAG: hypothetical protein ACRKGH_06235 [Dehalogenimonas sp.]
MLDQSRTTQRRKQLPAADEKRLTEDIVTLATKDKPFPHLEGRAMTHRVLPSSILEIALKKIWQKSVERARGDDLKPMTSMANLSLPFVASISTPVLSLTLAWLNQMPPFTGYSLNSTCNIWFDTPFPFC